MFDPLYAWRLGQAPAPQKRKKSRRASSQADSIAKLILELPPTTPARIEAPVADLELHRFGGLQGLRKQGSQKVRVGDPFQKIYLSFPSPIAADNWRVSCFGRSLACSVPSSPMVALDRGRLIRTRAALLLQTEGAPIVDFIARRWDDEEREKWRRFQVIALAHGFQPALRTVQGIHEDAMRVGNLAVMCQHLFTHVGDNRIQRATALVERFVRSHRLTTMSELCAAVAHGLAPAAAVECAAILLYRAGVIQLNISEATYGPQTTVQPV